MIFQESETVELKSIVRNDTRITIASQIGEGETVTSMMRNRAIGGR